MVAGSNPAGGASSQIRKSADVVVVEAPPANHAPAHVSGPSITRRS